MFTLELERWGGTKAKETLPVQAILHYNNEAMNFFHCLLRLQHNYRYCVKFPTPNSSLLHVCVDARDVYDFEACKSMVNVSNVSFREKLMGLKRNACGFYIIIMWKWMVLRCARAPRRNHYCAIIVPGKLPTVWVCVPWDNPICMRSLAITCDISPHRKIFRSNFPIRLESGFFLGFASNFEIEMRNRRCNLHQ